MDSWPLFGASVLACALLLVAPGALTLRGAGKRMGVALGAGAPLTTFIIAACGIVLHAVGLDGTFTCIGASLAVALAAAGALWLATRGKASEQDEAQIPFSPALALAFVCAGVLLTGMLFIKNLDGPSSFLQTSDNVSHLARIGIIAKTGNCSTIMTSSVMGSAPLNELPFVSEGGFYPALFHVLCAMLMNIFGIVSTTAENAVLTALVAFVFPLGLYTMLAHALKEQRFAIPFAMVTMFAGQAFPVRLLTVHAIYSYALGMCCVPALMVLVFWAFPDEDDAPVLRPGWLAAVVLSIAGFGAAHPSTVFSAALLAFPYLLLSWCPRIPAKTRLKAPVWALQLIFCALAAIAWLVLLESPLMSGVSSFVWYIFHSLPEALWRVASFGTAVGTPQYLMAALVLAGIVIAWREKRLRWCAVAYLIVCVQYVLNAVGDVDLKRLVSGFWYTDPERIFTMIAMYSIPLTALALHALARVIARAFKGMRQGSRGWAALVAGLCLIFSAINYYPYIPEFLPGYGAPFEYPIYALQYEEKFDEYKTYTPSEQEFVRKVMATVPQDALIINMPYDGSAFASLIDGLHAYYRTYANHLVYRGQSETDESVTLRLKLNQIASDPEVQEAVEKTGAQYVLLLSTKEYEDAIDDGGIEVSESPFIQYIPYRYEGLEIDEGTPGFELVLKQDDMALYRIAA